LCTRKLGEYQQKHFTFWFTLTKLANLLQKYRSAQSYVLYIFSLQYMYCNQKYEKLTHFSTIAVHLILIYTIYLLFCFDTLSLIRHSIGESKVKICKTICYSPILFECDFSILFSVYCKTIRYIPLLFESDISILFSVSDKYRILNHRYLYLASKLAKLE
jgi:hypothetical protein